jgi:hypothetical protein
LLKAHEGAFESGGCGEVVGVKNLALDDRKIDLDRVEPAGVKRRVNKNDVWSFGSLHRAKLFGRCERKTGIAPFDRLVAQVMREDRTISVCVQVSSMSTNLAGSNMPCSCIQRRRARATPARFCSAAYKVFL